MEVKLKVSPLYPVLESDKESTRQDVTLTELIPQRPPTGSRPFVNPNGLKSKVPITTWDPSSSSYLSAPIMEKFVIPRCSLRRLRVWHRAIKGTAAEYAARLVSIFPELAEIGDEEIEKTLRRMRRKEEFEP